MDDSVYVEVLFDRVVLVSLGKKCDIPTEYISAGRYRCVAKIPAEILERFQVTSVRYWYYLHKHKSGTWLLKSQFVEVLCLLCLTQQSTIKRIIKSINSAVFFNARYRVCYNIPGACIVYCK